MRLSRGRTSVAKSSSRRVAARSRASLEGRESRREMPTLLKVRVDLKALTAAGPAVVRVPSAVCASISPAARRAAKR
jgi:hypothetical protein